MKGKPLDINIKEACRCDYMKGSSVKDVAIKFGISMGTLQKIATREGWNDTRTKIVDRQDGMALAVNEKVVEKMVDRASLRVASHLETVFSTGSNFMKQLESTLSGLALGPVTDAQGAVAAITAYGKADSLVRRSLGLSDSIAQVDVTSAGRAISGERVMQLIQASRELVEQGKPALDIEACDALEAKVKAESDCKA